MLLNKRQHRFRKGLRSGRLIRRNRSRPDENLVLGNQPVGRNGSRDRESRCIRRMAVHYRLGSRIGFVNLKVQQKLAGQRSVARKYFPVQVRQADVRCGQVRLAQHGRRTKHELRSQPHADVAAVAVNILLGPITCGR